MDDQINYYDWVPFFHDICEGIALLSARENRDALLFEKARQTFDAQDPILRFPYTDPFSYLYALAQRNTVNQSDAYFERARIAFDSGTPIPTDLVFPTPQPNSLSLFYDHGEYLSKNGTDIGSQAIWELFGSLHRRETVDDIVFQTVLSLRNVGVVKLTQVIFLVDPENYIPFDTRMNSLPVPDLANLKVTVARISEIGLPAYREAINELLRWFRGCKLYEINLLNWLINTTYADRLLLESRYCQISSYSDGQQNEDHFGQFVAENAVWTGGPTGKTGQRTYPLEKFNRGDVVLVRRGTVWLGGIGIILNNGYRAAGWEEDKNIQILWLVKADRKISDTRLGQWIGFDEASPKTLSCFRNVYPDTFQLLDQIRQKQRKTMNHRLNKQKNIILSGPPGTGKTRKALQIAEWLTSSEDHTVSLLEAIDSRVIPNTEPDIEQIPEAELIQFHPSYTYEDFVRGIVTVSDQGKISYQVENRTLGKMAMEASKAENSDKAYVLIIDEINRANLSSVLGELIYALEYRGKTVDTLYAFDNDTGLSLPENLYIIGTMNTADRSIGHIDYAIRRRFAFVPVPPDASAIHSTMARTLYDQVQKIFDDNTSQEFDAADVRIGHSYFLGADASLDLRLKYEIKPILLEYVRDGVLLETAKPLINDLNV
jgi:hypothetical protein